jgi:hypothetical protein
VPPRPRFKLETRRWTRTIKHTQETLEWEFETPGSLGIGEVTINLAKPNGHQSKVFCICEWNNGTKVDKDCQDACELLA